MVESSHCNLNPETDYNHLIFYHYLLNYIILPETGKVTWVLDLGEPSCAITSILKTNKHGPTKGST